MTGHQAIITRLASPTSFPLDPRYQRTRTPIASVRPSVRVFGRYERDLSCLLSLPDEILWNIVGFLAEENQGRYLSQFALAHRECRQLALPYQFADVWITRSTLSEDFVRHLKHESLDGRESTIGSLIRSLTITVDKEYDIEFGARPGENDPWDEWTDYWQSFIDTLGDVVQSCTPNINQVYWMDTARFDPQKHLLPAVLRHALPGGRLQTLYFEEFEFSLSELEEVRSVFNDVGNEEPLGIRDLAFGVYRFDYEVPGVREAIALFHETVLRRAAPCLEYFAWNFPIGSDWAPEDTDGTLSEIKFRDGPIVFNKLRKFWSLSDDWDSYMLIRPSVVECFLSAPLESFAPSRNICNVMLAHNLVEKYPLPYLRTFAVTAELDQGFERHDYMDKVLELGRQYGPQLEELFIYIRRDHDERPDPIVSHISSGSFCNLRSLCFSWHNDPELRILQAIGTHLPMLEELSFGFEPRESKTAGNGPTDHAFNWDWNGSPCHDDFIAAIAPLQNLARLSVFGDEYVADWAGDDWAWHRFYKEHVWFNQGRSFTKRQVETYPRKGQTWSEATRGHRRPGDEVEDWLTTWVTGTASPEEARRAMGEIAAKYAEAFPKLKAFMGGRVLVEIDGR